jgi:hypothetical protein
MQLSLEDIDYSSPQGVSGLKLSFPKSREAFSIALSDLNLPSSIAEISIRIEAPPKAAETLRRLLDAVAFPLPLDSLPKAGSTTFRKNLGWALSYYQRYWKTILEWAGCTETTSKGSNSLTRLCLDLLASIRICYTCSSRFFQETSLNQQAVFTWLQCGADMLASTKLSSIPDIQHVLCQQLNEAVQISHTFPGVAMFVEEAFLSLSIDISRNETCIQSFNPSLQVSTANMTLFSGYIYANFLQQALERILNREYQLSKSASQTELQPSRSRNGSKSGSVTTSPRPSSGLTPSGEEPIPDARAHKRLRLSQSGIDVPISGLAQTLTTEVCQLLGHPNSTGLNGLSLVASYVYPASYNQA